MYEAAAVGGVDLLLLCQAPAGNCYDGKERTLTFARTRRCFAYVSCPKPPLTTTLGVLQQLSPTHLRTCLFMWQMPLNVCPSRNRRGPSTLAARRSSISSGLSSACAGSVSAMFQPHTSQNTGMCCA